MFLFLEYFHDFKHGSLIMDISVGVACPERDSLFSKNHFSVNFLLYVWELYPLLFQGGWDKKEHLIGKSTVELLYHNKYKNFKLSLYGKVFWLLKWPYSVQMNYDKLLEEKTLRS
jgi:hypothetical protein